MTSSPRKSEFVNVAARLSETARAMPDAPGVIVPGRRSRDGGRQYGTHTFRQLDDDSNRLASGLQQLGVAPGIRLALLVRPGFDFISLVFALMKAGAVSILIDPGMGRKNVLRCLDEVRPQGFVAIPVVHAVRCLLGRRYRDARFNVTVGRRWFWGGVTLEGLRRMGAEKPAEIVITKDDPASIIFTTGSTGPPKGVLYRHGHFARQVEEIRDFYGIQPGEIDVACFPLFALFNCAMGVTTIVPEMDFSRPATVDPRNIIEPIRDLKATQAFASPAVWNRVSRYCQDHGETLPSLRRVLSAGAPVPADVLARMKESIHPEGDVHTPYGATEALPVASIAASEVLAETAEQTRQGRGVCVGRRFPGIDWKVIRIVDGPIVKLAEIHELPHGKSVEPPLGESRETPLGEIGELIVRGGVVTDLYVNRPDSNVLGKIADGEKVWHRMGDVGYLDEQDRFWFCGRMAHRVTTPDGPMFTIPCEAIFNRHEAVYRSALVGIGEPGAQRPVIVLEPLAERFPRTDAARTQLRDEALRLASSSELTRAIEDVLFHRSFPVDIRHNAKIFREKLAVWAAGQLGV